MSDSDTYSNQILPIGDAEPGFVSVSKAAEILNVSKGTLHRWDREGILSAARLPNGHRRYSVAKLREILGAA
jgi:excisionase family DNA binding protein